MNIRINKKAISILALTTVTLFSGCSTGSKDENKSIDEKSLKQEKHIHLIINFDKPVVFRECEGFKIDGNISNGRLYYNISYDEKNFLSGSTNDGNLYEVYNEEYAKKLEEQNNIQSAPKVYVLK